MDPHFVCLSCIAFVDDCYLFARNLQDAQEILNDVVEAFQKVQLSLAPEKVNFIAEKHLTHVTRPCLTLAGSEIEKVDNLKILGSMVDSKGNERVVFERRIGAGWVGYNKWKHVLGGGASIEAKMKLFQNTVSRSLLWGLQSTRTDAHNHAKLLSAQKFIVREVI